MENWGFLYAVFIDNTALNQFCWYIDNETRPAFVEEVPDGEHKLFELIEQLEIPESKQQPHKNAVLYSFEMMDEVEDDYAALLKIATMLGAKTVISHWFSEYETDELQVYHQGKQKRYTSENQPFIKDADLSELNDLEIIASVMDKLNSL